MRALSAGLAGGLLAGALVGAAEAVAAWVHAHGAGEVPALAWGMVFYGALGALMGLGAGVVGAVLRTDGFGLALAGVVATVGFVVGRFRIVRDVFMEQLPRGPLTPLVQLGALVVVAVLAFLLWRWLRGADARRRPLTRPAIAAALVAILAGGWAAFAALRPVPPPVRQASGRPARDGAPPVVLIAIDTLRADRLATYGATDVRTPHIDRLAADGVRFDSAFAQASWTRPSFGTILTGLYPSSHGAVHKADSLPGRVDTIAEMLAFGGYRTVGFANNANIAPTFNFQQGFEEYHYLAPDFFFGADEPASALALYNILRLLRERFFSRNVNVHNYYQPAETVTAKVRAWLDGAGSDARPLFLFIHYMDPHDPYMVRPYNGEGYARVANPNPPASLAQKYRNLYDREVEHADTHIGVLLDDLRKRGIYDRALIVLTADHGEEFHDHGGWWHGTTLYEEQIKIPLVVKPPRGKGTPGRASDLLATHLDVVPTILTSAGLPVPPVVQGHALPLDGGVAPNRQTVFSESDLEGNVLKSVRGKEWKLIVANEGNPRGLKPEEMFDVAKDPGEKTDLIGSKPDQAEIMRAEMGRSTLVAQEHAGQAEQAGMDAATQDRLKALGYVH
jgi:arylsulfatase A-like enzyme